MPRFFDPRSLNEIRKYWKYMYEKCLCSNYMYTLAVHSITKYISYYGKLNTFKMRYFVAKLSNFVQTMDEF